MADDLSLRHALVRHAMARLDAGDHAISLRGLARAAGVSAMAPYRHFADKAALMEAVAEEGFAILRADLIAADRAEGAAALLAQGRAYIAFARQRPGLFRLMFAGPISATKPLPGGDNAFTVLADRVKSLRGDAGSAGAVAAWGIVHGLAMLILDGRLAPDDGAADAALSLFVADLVGDAAAAPDARPG